MAVTENTYTGNGSTVTYSFTFPYLEETHVKVRLNGVLTTAYTFANATTIQFNTAPASGVAIRIYRDTDIDSVSATFFAGSAIRAQDLNENFLQNNYTVQEIQDRYIDRNFGGTITGNVTIVGNTTLNGTVDINGDLDMNSNSITNVDAPSAGGDVTNRTYVDTQDALKVAKAGDTMTGNLAMSSNKVTGLATPTDAADAATKSYVDTQDALRVAKAGDTMTGNLAMSSNKVTGLAAPTDAGDATNKTYVDAQVALKVSKSGDTMSGALNMGNNLITNLATPVSATDAVTKGYVDTNYGQVGNTEIAQAANVVYTAVGGETSLVSGTAGVPQFEVSIGLVQVFLNGALQQQTADYTVDSPTRINFVVPLTAGDIVGIYCINNISTPTVQIAGTINYVGPPTTDGTTLGDVLTDTNGTGWLWDGDSWGSVGIIRGPVGPTGPVGPAGPTGPTGPAATQQFNSQTFTATAGQTDFTATFVTGEEAVYLNGVLQTTTADYTIPSANTVRFNTGLIAGDVVNIRGYSVQLYNASDIAEVANDGNNYVRTYGNWVQFTPLPAVGTARQLLQVNAGGTAAEWTSNVDVPGTLDVTGAATFDAGVTIGGNLTVNGTTTTINSTTIAVDDKNIVLGDVGTPTDFTADGGGITLRGATDKTINWIDATDAWTLSEHVNIASGKEYRIAGTKVLDATSLGNAVVSSNLTSVGTIGTGVWQGTAIDSAYLDSTIVTTGDTGTVTSTMIADGTIVNADVNASAAIAGTKISPNFGNQTVSTTNSLVLDRNIASPSNYWNGLQQEIRATSGTAGISLHRSGFSHVGIYHDAIDTLKFNMTNGMPVLNHNAGTIWGSGNDGSGSGLDADLLDGHHRDQAANGNTVAGRDSSGDITVRLIRQNYQDQNTISGGMVFRVNNSTDNYLRVCNDTGAIRTFLNVPTRTGGNASGTWGISVTGSSASCTGNAATATTATNASILYSTNTAYVPVLGGDFAWNDTTQNKVSRVSRCQTAAQFSFNRNTAFSVIAGGISSVGVYNSTTGTDPLVRINANGTMRRDSSSAKYKTDIQDIEYSYTENFLDNARPVWYRANVPDPEYPQEYLDSLTDEQEPSLLDCWSFVEGANADGAKIDWDYTSKCHNEGVNPDWGWWGFIAEELAEIDPRLVYFDANTGEPEAINYDRAVPHIIVELKKKRQEVKDLQAQLALLVTRVESLEARS